MGNPDDARRLAELSRVVGLSLSRDRDELSLILRMREEKTRSDVVYEFSNVTDLQFRGERTELNEIVLMLSEDISSNGWESARFRVKDSEEEFLSFFCEGIRHLT